MKKIYLAVLLIFALNVLKAQDAILISDNNFVRGVIEAASGSSVAILTDDQQKAIYQAKDIKSFVWNGETYESKPIVLKKRAEYRFFKLIEGGKVNLYSYGDFGAMEQPVQQRTRVRPNIGVGLGTGGFGGGIGGGVSINIGGGRRNEEASGPIAKAKVSYFIEKPGTGPMQEVSLNNTSAVKTVLLQKLKEDEDLAKSIEATEGFDAKNLAAYVKAYNSGRL